MKLRGALLGAGNIALGGHLPQWTQDEALGREVEIVALADLSPKNLEAAKALLPSARLYEGADELLSRETLDFVDVCTPPFTHRALVLTAAARGLHVVCEKPLAPTLQDAEAIATVVRDAGIVFQPCHQYHHSPQWAAVRALLPRLGRIYLSDYEVRRTEANPGNVHWSPTWRTQRELAGGGILVDHGAHIFYQLRSVLGEPRKVSATVRTLAHETYGVEDTAFVLLDFGEALAEVRLTWAAHERRIQFRFVGEHGELVGGDERIELRVGSEVETIPFAEGMSKGSSHSGWYAPMLREFVRRVRAGHLGTEGLDEALYVTRLVARCYESSEAGRSLPIP